MSTFPWNHSEEMDIRLDNKKRQIGCELTVINWPFLDVAFAIFVAA